MIGVSDKFRRCHAFVARWEGGYTDDKNDAGGVTNYGVSKRFLEDLARREPVRVAMLGIDIPVTKRTIRELTKDQAMRLFHDEFWKPLRCDELPMPVALCLYDMAVNHGGFGAVRICQKACNDAGYGLAVDGIIGPKTIKALCGMSRVAGLTTIAAERQRYYDDIVRRKPSQEDFINGWTNRCNAMLDEALGMVVA